MTVKLPPWFHAVLCNPCLVEHGKCWMACGRCVTLQFSDVPSTLLQLPLEQSGNLTQRIGGQDVRPKLTSAGSPSHQCRLCLSVRCCAQLDSLGQEGPRKIKIEHDPNISGRLGFDA
eukprot:1997540-Amphidinium_carterae.1